MNKKLICLSLLAVTALSINSCNNDDDSGNPKTVVKFLHSSECLGSPFGSDSNDGEVNQVLAPYIYYDYDKGVGLAALRLNNFVSNCSAIPKMDIRLDGDTIVFNAYNSGDESSNCLCRYELTAEMEHTVPKVYYIRPEKLTSPNDIQIIDLTKNRNGSVYFTDIY